VGVPSRMDKLALLIDVSTLAEARILSLNDRKPLKNCHPNGAVGHQG